MTFQELGINKDKGHTSQSANIKNKKTFSKLHLQSFHAVSLLTKLAILKHFLDTAEQHSTVLNYYMRLI